MLSSEDILTAIAGVREEDILAAGQAMGYLPGVRKKNIWRPLLIAAVLAALFTATVVAAELLGRADRLAPMPPDESGEARQAEIPNGFRGTPTYQGSAEWWTYMAQWDLAHGREVPDYSLSFIDGDLDRYLVCSLYEAWDPDQAATLYEIAKTYDLKLYREAVYLGQEEETFYALTGAEPFLDQKTLRLWGGYVLEDGSFSAELSLETERLPLGCTVKRYYAGSIFPFGGAGRTREYRETEYVTAQGYSVFLDIFGPFQGEITYCDPQGETYITLLPHIPSDRDPEEICRQAADQVDFDALCRRDTARVLELLNRPTGAEKNPEAVKRLEAFQNSSVFRAGEEFQRFYEENFYGFCFTGTYGMEGCEDVDRELDRLAEKYGLTYAREKTWGNDLSRDAAVFDNGAWQARPKGTRLVQYIPKDALFTMQQNFLDIHAYRRIWEYETEEGQNLVLCTQGPLHSREVGGYAFLETEDAYVLLKSSGSPLWMEQQAEAFDWTIFERQEDTK